MRTPNNNSTNHDNDDSSSFLLCDEVLWDDDHDHMMISPSPGLLPSSSSSSVHPTNHHLINTTSNVNDNSSMTTHHDIKHSFDTYLQRETNNMISRPLQYITRLQSDRFLADWRFKAIRWFLHCQRQFNFGMESVFKALNYVDRFIDMNKCHGWSYWMMELMSLASFSIAIKFGETCPPSLRQIQKGLEYYFEAKLIHKMEMKILKSLGWEVNSVTPYSYVELIQWELASRNFKPFVRSRLDDILVASSLDVKLLQYRPCVIAMSGLRCILEDEEDSLSHIITTFIPTDQKENIECCYNIMQESMLSGGNQQNPTRNPCSPDTVLLTSGELQVAAAAVPIHEEEIDLSFIDDHKPAAMKRKRKGDDDFVNNNNNKKYNNNNKKNKNKKKYM